MRTILILATLTACSSSPSTAPDAADLADAQTAPDADPSTPIALEPGVYSLTWSCVTGCGPLLFPPAAFGRLDVDDGLALHYNAPGTAEQYDAAGELDADDCVAVPGFAWSVGSTLAYRWCAAIGGPVAEVTYTPTTEGYSSTYRVTATR
jgi:hypothetical protein